MDIPTGRCDRVLAREFWLRGKRVLEACVLFLRIGGAWFRVAYDDEDRKWNGAVSKEIPVAGLSSGDEEFFYPVVDLIQRHGMEPAEIESAREEDLGESARATI